MFLLNSRPGHFSAAFSCSTSSLLHNTQASLLPKLRDHFAEFLNEGSLARLRILSSPTCVGLRYGLLYTRQRLFLAAWDQSVPLLIFAPHHISGIRQAYFTT